MKSLADIAKCTILTEADLEKIEQELLKSGNFSLERIRQQIEAVCCNIGLDDYYFQTTPLTEIARLIESMRAAEIISQLDQKKEVNLDLRSEHDTTAMYVASDIHNEAIKIERHIEERYPLHRIHSYRTRGTLLDTHLRIYLVTKPVFENPDLPLDEVDIRKIGGKYFLQITPEDTLKRYQQLVINGSDQDLYMEFSEKLESTETRLMILTHASCVRWLFSAISDVINYYGIYTNRKYFEPFANGKVAFSFYFNRIKDATTLENIKEDISLVFALPENKLSPQFRASQISAQEMCYGVVAANFAHQFLTSYGSEYVELIEVLKDQPELKGTLETIRYNLLKEAYSEDRVFTAISNNVSVLKKLYAHFECKFLPGKNTRDCNQKHDDVLKEIKTAVELEMDRHILNFLLTFNNQTLKTNFYFPGKRSLAFRLSPDFLPAVEYPEKPFGIFFILGSEFKGFHVRFRDIARGGIRIVRSLDEENYLDNSDAIFDENYNLARTQQFKNKDIPEGGSKGALLLNLDSQTQAEQAFHKYIDSILNLILPNDTIVDYYGKEEILFLGPDEGTAELMDWASSHAKKRGYKFWKAFSTGKSLANGGIPHDVYGMTTNSVHQYAIKTLEKLGLKEENMSKFQTGGPDGDLGSNEILISRDKIIAIVDGSGVAYDPQGLNRKELTRLAKLRKMINHFDKTKLSAHGYIVLVTDHDVQLPGGKVVTDGTFFRNTFHLRQDISADFFIPCGGRPKSIHIGNWTNMLDDKGRLRFKYIIEGANLFITQDARLRLEEKGAIIYKDASANKGGVTSSSLEVFASLALNDDQYENWMCVKNDKLPEFRKKYVEQVLDVVRRNAVNEFDVIWRENEKTGIKRSILTDLVSKKINDITDQIRESRLYDNDKLRRKVISDHCPPILLEHLGYETILERVPENYLRAIFASHLASRYVYRYGLGSSEVYFMTFIQELETL